ncbi:hypothetical protein ACR3H8_19840 [Pseudomonas aeruginosa]|uniref:hypothetical protein n=1 Tax=Pseudomonas aeruginosa group TaxID=136841 RepID=UPI0003BB35D5|nr:hypothetical protein [Pseudomonas aeruginosa]EIU2716156.1 hypothetical protein [Pseudomonas aeruginosa]EIU2862975.1 hypothetical protein [Pseudomonas aeruginosa]ELD5772764.1 hypothetical protein [Pseudomonas aeruginosa]ERW61403.1 hypothetical protein Q024_06450 [Pseudomonas aeruginosa BWHPSA011]ETV28875.1 hypothetical protein Q046_05792 [Pseudomonas aeruginosa BWHPSA041]
MTPELQGWLNANLAPKVPAAYVDPEQLALQAEMRARGVRFLPAQVERRVLRAYRQRVAG